MAKNWRSTREYRVWRATVIRRDKVCQICKTRKRRHAHHIRHATYFQEQRFDPDNGVTLCATCHMVVHTKFADSYRSKCTERHWAQFQYTAKYLEECFDNESTA